MAYGDENTTLESFDSIIPDYVFKDVTSITVDQFRLLRDGGDVTDPETGEKVIYICDANNNCVRMYNMETKLMSTVAGIGGKSGYAAGNPTVSRMNRPYGICITPENDIYIADAGNKVIMKLAFM